MKKTNNKGFSLVELIIVIAIMAILAGAIAPALIKYIDKSRKTNDVSSAKTIKTAVETALGNESIYEFLTTTDSSYKCTIIELTPGTATSGGSGVVIKKGGATASINGKSANDLKTLAQTEIGNTVGEKIPKLKYTKAMKIGANSVTPKKYYAVISESGTVYVFIGDGVDTVAPTSSSSAGLTSTKGWQISPYIADEYQ